MPPKDPLEARVKLIESNLMAVAFFHETSNSITYRKGLDASARRIILNAFPSNPKLQRKMRCCYDVAKYIVYHPEDKY